MESRIEFFDENYLSLHPDMARDLFTLRGNTFHSRLAWQVQCDNGLECDEFDNQDARYLLGMSGGKLLCGARFIDIRKANMITRVFGEFFGGVTLPENVACYDVSRLFIDKARRDEAGLSGAPVSQLLFMAMVRLCQRRAREGMYAVVSRGMYRIFMQSGWGIRMLKRGESEKGEAVYFIYMPATGEALQGLTENMPG